MAITFDGPTQLIMLDGATSQSIRAIYSRWVDWANQSDNAKWPAAFSTIADPPTVPVYAFLENGWRVQPLGTSSEYTLNLTDGFLQVSGDASADPIAPVSSGVEPRIRYQNPVIAVGFSSGSGLSPEQDALLTSINNVVAANQTLVDELHKLQGLNSSHPMTVTPTTRTAGEISQAITGDGETTTTVTRQ